MALKLSKDDARRGFVNFQLQGGTLPEVFARLRSVQFDPLAPAGSNHDFVLQARVPRYKVGDWQKTAYKQRLIYDGWDKQACLIQMSGWALRRIQYQWYQHRYEQHREAYGSAIDSVLNEIAKRGPLAPRDFEFQERRDEYHGSWWGPNITKRALRTLWHAGLVMTHSRRSGQHVYDLTERIVPAEYYAEPLLTEAEALEGLLLDRHEGVGLVRPNASYEMWAMSELGSKARYEAIGRLVQRGELVEVDVEGVKANASRDFIAQLETGEVEKKVAFLGPLDQIMWDRKLVQHLFGFDYIWEVYKPLEQRQWGYYVLPVLFGDRFVGRFEPWARNGKLEIRCWHWEAKSPPKGFWDPYRKSMKRFMRYCGATELELASGVDPRLGDLR